MNAENMIYFVRCSQMGEIKPHCLGGTEKSGKTIIKKGQGSSNISIWCSWQEGRVNGQKRRADVSGSRHFSFCFLIYFY